LKKLVLLVITFTVQSIYSQSSQNSVIDNDEKEYLRKFVYPLQSYEPKVGFKKDSLVFNKFFLNDKNVGLGEE